LNSVSGGEVCSRFVNVLQDLDDQADMPSRSVVFTIGTG
jgi:hypothetical protein